MPVRTRILLLVIPCVWLSADGAFARQEGAPLLQDPAEREYLNGLRDAVALGELKMARRELREYLDEAPGAEFAKLLYADVLRLSGRYEDARAQIESARPAAEADTGELAVDWGVAAGNLLLEVGDHEALGKLLERELGRRPQDPALLARKVMMLARSGQLGAAREVARSMPKTRLARDGDVAILLETARAYSELGDIEFATKAAAYAEVQLRRGDARHADSLLLLGAQYLAVRQKDGNEAIKAFRDALEADATAVEAHVGIGRARIYRARWDLTAEPIESAEEVNPNHPEVVALKAERMLYSRDFSGGVEVAERGLSVNPRHRRCLAARCTGLLLLSDPKFDAALEEMLAVDPRYAAGFELMADLVAYHYRFAAAEEWYRKAIDLDPEHATSFVGLARCLANTGRFSEALQQLAEFRKFDKYEHVWAANMKASLEALDQNVATKDGNFRYLIDPLEQPVMLPLLRDLYRERWADFCRRYELDPKGAVQVEVFPVHDDFSARTVGFTGFGALGVCFGPTLALVSPRSELRGSFEWESTAVHELAHVVSLRLSRQRVPRWLTEGMSVYEERIYKPICDREMDLELFHYFHSGEVIPVAELNQLFSGPKILFGYYQAGLLCEFIVETFGQSALVEMLRSYAEDLETEQVVKRALKIEAVELDQRFLAWIDAKFLSAMKVQPVYTEAGRTRLLDQLYDFDDDSEAPAPLLAQIAWAYHQAGREIDRDRFLALAVAAGPERPEVMFLQGRRLLDKGARAEGQELLERAVGNGGEEFFAFITLADLSIGEDLEARLEYLSRAKACFPRYVGPHNPYLLRAALLQKEGEEEAALKEYRAYCAIHETDPGPRQVLVANALEREDWAEAEGYLLELRAIDPFVREFHRDLARCQRALARPSAAIRSLEIALAVAPETEPDYDPAAPLDEREARDRLSRAALHLDLAEIYAEVREPERAREQCRRARELDPGSSRADEIEARLGESG